MDQSKRARGEVTISSAMAERLLRITWLGCCPKFSSTLWVTRLRSTGRTRSSSLPGSRLPTASPTACGGERLAGTRRRVSSVLASDDSNGGAVRRVLQRRMPLQQVLVTLHQTNPRQRAKARRQEEGRKELVPHPLEPLRRQRRRLDPVPTWGVLCVSFGSSVAFVKPTPSRRAAGRGRSCSHKRVRPCPVHRFARHSAGW